MAKIMSINFLAITFDPVGRLNPNFECGRIYRVDGLFTKTACMKNKWITRVKIFCIAFGSGEAAYKALVVESVYVTYRESSVAVNCVPPGQIPLAEDDASSVGSDTSSIKKQSVLPPVVVGSTAVPTLSGHSFTSDPVPGSAKNGPSGLQMVRHV